MPTADDASLTNEDLLVLNNLLGREEQSFEQFSNMFNLISVGESPSLTSESVPSEDNIDGILSYLETRENDVISGQNHDEALDIGTFTVMSQSIPQSDTIRELDTFSNGGLQCLDVMLNHLQARETSLERSPEYSVELNMRNAVQINNGQLQSAVDNRFVTDSSENCSSEVPDNDRGAVNNSGMSLVGTHVSQTDDFEVIELDAPEQMRNDSVTNTDILSEFIEQPVNLRIDNFVSADCGYDSDKDIDESEIQPEGDLSDTHPYIPSFHSNNITPTVNSASSANASAMNDAAAAVPATPDHIPNNDDYISLPGEIDRSNFAPNSTSRVHLRSGRESVNGGETQSPSDIIADQIDSQSHEDNNTVEPFQLDSNFDYENVRITSRLNHYNR